MKPRAAVVLIITVFVAAVAAAQQPAQNSSSPVPHLIPYSGVARDVSGKALSGTVGITFLLYQHEQGGSPLWLETQNVQLDARGQYSVQLGATLPNGMPNDLFVSGEARWLAVQIAGQAETGRVMLLSVPYALKAGDAATVGGLPPSAFVLAAPQDAASSGTSSASSNSDGNSPPLGGSGSANYLAMWTDNKGDLGDSSIFQGGTASKPKIGIGTTKPASTLDVKGGSTIRGLFSFQATGTATATAGFNSQPMDLVSSGFNSGSNTAVPQTFQWQAEPAANDTSSPSGTLNLLFGSGTTKPTETGLNIASDGQITFAANQTFPGTGTITGVTTAGGSGLMGGGTSGNLNLALTNSCSTNQVLQWSGSSWVCATISGGGTITGVTAGTDLTGGGTSGNVTLNLDTTKVPQLATPNVFAGTQTVGSGDLTINTGNLDLPQTGGASSGVLTLGAKPFLHACCGSSTFNTFVGTNAGNLTSPASYNTAVGYQALTSLNSASSTANTAVGTTALTGNTTGSSNTAVGTASLQVNTTGTSNTAVGAGALESNGLGSSNTALGSGAGHSNTGGSNNTFVGQGADAGAQTLTNATAIGSAAIVNESNALVLGAPGVNVGIGTATPAYALDVHGTGNFTGAVAFSSSQTFPNTISGVTTAAGSGLMGGGNTGTLSLSLLNTCSSGQVLTWSGSAWVCTGLSGGGTITGVTAGTDLTGGGQGGNVTLNLDTTKVPQLATANTFSATQTISSGDLVVGNGNIVLPENSCCGDQGEILIGGNSFISTCCTVNAANTYVGMQAGSLSNTAAENTAEGFAALASLTQGQSNTGSGFNSLGHDDAGSNNTGIGANALFTNSAGANNTALGFNAGANGNFINITGSNNTFLGYESAPGATQLTNATAIGANALVSENNALVLGSIAGLNGATANTNVGIGTNTPAYTLDVFGTGRFTGLVTFASGQTFPGTGTVTSVGSGPGLTGGPITGSGSLSIATGGVTNAMLANSSVTINPGTDLLGGGPVSLGGATALSLDTTKVPQLSTANTFTGNQTVNGNLSATGAVTGSSFQIGGSLFGFGNAANLNAFLGFAGNTTMTGTVNTATGAQALSSNTTGYTNTADGQGALFSNTTGNYNTGTGQAALYDNISGSNNTATGYSAMIHNTGDSTSYGGGYNAAFGALSLLTNTIGAGNTGIGYSSLEFNTTGSNNTATGYAAGITLDSLPGTGSRNTFVGAYSAVSTGALNNATAIGSLAEVTESNALVLGPISGVNGCTPIENCASVNVGIGITNPTYLLHIGNMGGASYNNFLRVEGPTAPGTGGLEGSFGGYGAFEIDSVGTPGGRFVVTEIGRVGIGAASPLVTHSLTIGQNTGHAIADSWDTYSSRRWKTNIQTLHGALAKVEHLRGVSYDLKESGKHEVGVIAEEVGAVVPEIVSWDENGKDARGVDYSRLTALLIEATKEQQALIQRQQAEIKAQQAVAEVQETQIASQRAQISQLRDRDAQQAHALQTVAAQMTLLQNKLARLERNVSDLRQASNRALAGANGRQVAVAIAQSVRP